jgi:hypothetical protein
VKSLELEMQTRRLTIRFYGNLTGRSDATQIGTIAFFGVGEIDIENPEGAFPDSAELADVEFSEYEEVSERGSVTLNGHAGWTLSWTYDGLAYEEYPAVVASLADES